MLGAIIGDIVGSRFEFNNTSNYDFELFSDECAFTDDTICTVAIADAILKGVDYRESIIDWCGRYPSPMGGYGASFAEWLRGKDKTPYYSFGNGAAMRISPVAWAFESESEVIRQAIKATEFSHNHPEGLIGAVSVALGIFRIRNNRESYIDIVDTLMNTSYGADWEKKLPPRMSYDETCQGCVPLAFHILKESSSFEDAIRRAVSYGGDSDTLGAIVGSLAEALCSIEEEICGRAIAFLPEEKWDVIESFNKRYMNRSLTD